MAEDNFYLTQRELFDEIIACRINDGKISDKLGEMFILLATKYSNHRFFVRYYHIKPDLIAAGMEACCKAFYKFRPHKDKEITWDEKTPIVFDHNIHNNSFAYFTTAIHHNFLSVVKKEYNQSNILNEMRLDNGMDASLGYEAMVAEREERERSEDDESATPMKTLDFTEQSVWDDYGPSDSLIDDEDEKIDWQEVVNG